MNTFIFVARPETNYGDVRSGRRKDWSCSDKARSGDRAYLYVTGGPGILEEWLVTTDRGEKTNQYFRCGVQFLRQLDRPIPIRELKLLAPEWPPFHQNLRGHHAILLPPEVAEAIASARPNMLDREIEDFERAVAKSLASPNAERAKRLAVASALPTRISTVQYVFRRNPDVVAVVLERAKGKCEKCKRNGPFISRTTGKPYLEVHHRKTLANGGEDTVQNAIALCPNCHRHAHYA